MNPSTCQNSSVAFNNLLTEVDPAELLAIAGGNLAAAGAIATIIYVMGEAAYSLGKLVGKAVR